MKRLRDAGNTLVVVEHDPQIMLAADRILDMGPGPGERGGEIVFFGPPEQARRRADADRGLPVRPQARRRAAAPAKPREFIEVLGAQPSTTSRTSTCASRSSAWCASPASRARASPRWCRTCSTRRCSSQGQADRGARRAPRAAGRRQGRRSGDGRPVADRQDHALQPGELRRRVRRDPRLFAKAAGSKERGYTPGTFSFNSGNGRCPTCSGCGFEHVEMQFLSDVYLRCPDCDGRRYRDEILEVSASTASRSPTCSR